MDIGIILKVPELVKDLKSADWRLLFTEQTLSRAQGYTKPSRFLDLEVIERRNQIAVSARFRGNSFREYRTILTFKNSGQYGWDFWTDCSCPVGYECKHAAAVLLLITEKLNSAATAAIPPALADDREIGEWMLSLTNSAKSTRSKTPKKAATNFLAYCLRPPLYGYDYEQNYRLTLHVGRTLKSGEVRMNLNSFATADPMKPPKYMAEEDTFPVTLFHQLQRSVYSYDGLVLQGPKAGLLLKEIFKTGRLYHVGKDKSITPITLGDEILPELTWENRPDGSARPVFAPPLSEHLALLASEPPYALRPSGEGTYQLNPLDVSQHSLDFLEAWLQGPVLRPEQVAKTAVVLQEKLPKLPQPVAPKTKKLKKSKPEIRLHLHRKNPFNHGGLHRSGSPEPVIAELSFVYHGHPFRPNLGERLPKSGTFTASQDGVVYTITRDTSVEEEAVFTLVKTHNFVPASVHDMDVASGLGSAFLPYCDPNDWNIQTAQFIIVAVPALRELGWEVTIDESSALQVHRIGDDELETGLSELPDHGIDWFEFSASYLTPSGEKQSILPLLGNFLEQLNFDAVDQLIAEAPEDDQTILVDPQDPNAFLSFPTVRLFKLAKTLHDLFGTTPPDEPLHRLQAAALADSLEMDSSQTLKDLAQLGNNLKNISTLPRPKPPKALEAELRDYQLDGFHWMQFLASHGLHGILADDMGLGKTVQTLAHLQAEVSSRRTQGTPCLVLAPTSVVGNWKAEAKKFTPKLKTLLLHGPERHEEFKKIPKSQLVITSYPLLVRDFDELSQHDFHLVILDEAQYIKNPTAKVSQLVCKLKARHRLSLSGTPLENHLGELWSQMRFLMPGLLGSSELFRKVYRTPIEKHQDSTAQLALNSRVAPLILRRTKDQVATELPPKTEIVHTIPLGTKQVDLYETVRAAMDERVREVIAAKGLAKSQIIVLDALLKLRQICCHPQLLKIEAAQKVTESAKLDFLTKELLPQLLEEGRKVLLFSTFTTMLAIIEKHLAKKKIPFAKITGQTKDRQKQIEDFQNGDVPVFLISLKAGGTGLNLTAADTVIHYDPWWNPAAENQATDRAYRIGQDKPVFVHKLVTEGSIEERIVELQAQKAKLVEALLSEKTTKLQLDQETLGNLLAPIE